MPATIDSVCLKLDSVLDKLGDIKKRNDEDHKAMAAEQKTTSDRLAKMDTQAAVAKKDTEANAKDIRHHAKRCEKRHAGLNKKLWAFVVAGLLAAGGIVLQFILGGAS